MTIDDVKRLPGEGSSEYGRGAWYRIPFQVYFSNGYSEAALRLNTDGRLPKLGYYLGQETSPVSTDTAVFLNKIDCSLAPNSPYTSDAKGIALYTCNYTQLNPQFNANPLLRKNVRWAGSSRREQVQHDINGNPIANSKGDLYPTGYQKPIRGADVVITIRQSSNPSSTVWNYSNSVNKYAIWGIPAECGMIGEIDAPICQEDGVTFWELTFPISFKRDTWRLQVFDSGFVYKNTDGDDQVATDKNGILKPVPVWLNGIDGTPLAEGTAPVIYPGAPLKQTPEGFPVLDQTDWSTLNLPNPFTYPL